MSFLRAREAVVHHGGLAEAGELVAVAVVDDDRGGGVGQVWRLGAASLDMFLDG